MRCNAPCHRPPVIIEPRRGPALSRLRNRVVNNDIMEPSKTTCRICNTEILVATASRTGGVCMPCCEGARYDYVDYLHVDDFFAKASGDDCLAPNLDPRPTKADFHVTL